MLTLELLDDVFEVLLQGLIGRDQGRDAVLGLASETVGVVDPSLVKHAAVLEPGGRRVAKHIQSMNMEVPVILVEQSSQTSVCREKSKIRSVSTTVLLIQLPPTLAKSEYKAPVRQSDCSNFSSGAINARLGSYLTLYLTFFSIVAWIKRSKRVRY